MDAELSLREARSRYFEENGFGSDGGYSRSWVTLELGPIPLAFPNTAARVRAVKRHDLHHVLTGYATTATGEAEIGAFEVASGCGRFWAAWALNLWAMTYGVLVTPRRLLRAFARGRRSDTLYRREVGEAELNGSVATLRDQLGIPPGDPPVTAGDAFGFAVWTAFAWLWSLAGLALLVAPMVLLARALD